jgi:hypothetical protein
VTAFTRKIRFTVLAALAVAALALVPAALAGKGGAAGKPGVGGSSSSSLSLVMVSDANLDGLPNFADVITFNVSTSASMPSVELACYQNGSLVYTSTRGFYPTYMWSDNYLLEGGYWAGGAANCTATLYTTSKSGSKTTLATLSVPVGA